MPKRAHITIKFSMDLDAVPGWGHEPSSWVDLITHSFVIQRHYNTSYEVKSIEVVGPPPPAGYQKRLDGLLCRCLNLWRAEDGSHWCCRPTQTSTNGTETP